MKTHHSSWQEHLINHKANMLAGALQNDQTIRRLHVSFSIFPLIHFDQRCSYRFDSSLPFLPGPSSLGANEKPTGHGELTPKKGTI